MSYFNRIILQEISERIKTILSVLVRPIWVNQTNGKVEVNTVSTITSVTDVAGISRIGGNPVHGVAPSLEKTSWCISVRSRIS